VPVSRRLALQLDTGLSLDTWAFATLGLRHRLFGDGGPGTWFVSGAFGLAMVIDKGGLQTTTRPSRDGDSGDIVRADDVRRPRIPLLTIVFR
jgi:hypothetical protein